MAEGSFHDQIVEQTGTRMEEEFWEETQEWMKKNPPHIPPTETLGEMRDREKREAEEAALKNSQASMVEPQSEAVSQPEDNEHFKAERRIFQITRTETIGKPDQRKISSVDLVHMIQGQDPKTSRPLFFPALAGELNGPSILKVEGPHGPIYYKTITSNEASEAEKIFRRDEIALPSSKFNNVYVELVPSLAMERGLHKDLPVIETKPFKN